MVETNSTDEEKTPGRPITGRAERRESPPREYVGTSPVSCTSARPSSSFQLLEGSGSGLVQCLKLLLALLCSLLGWSLNDLQLILCLLSFLINANLTE